MDFSCLAVLLLFQPNQNLKLMFFDWMIWMIKIKTVRNRFFQKFCIKLFQKRLFGFGIKNFCSKIIINLFSAGKFTFNYKKSWIKLIQNMSNYFDIYRPFSLAVIDRLQKNAAPCICSTHCVTWWSIYFTNLCSATSKNIVLQRAKFAFKILIWIFY